MYKALAKVHTTSNGSRLRIKVPEDIVTNISGCFAQARMLNLDLARRTESFFVEWPNRLLTVAVPTDFQLKPAWSTQGNYKYALYHKTEWPIVPKILSECMVRPADWTKDNKGVPITNTQVTALLVWLSKLVQFALLYNLTLRTSFRMVCSRLGKASSVRGSSGFFNVLR